MRRRLLLGGVVTALVLTVGAGPALACGGLVSPNGTIALVRTTTLAAYHDGVEHYVTGFQFVGGGAEFGSIVPLPAVPTKVIRGGNWTLQRLELEVNPVLRDARVLAVGAVPATESAIVLQRKQIDSLDITILKGGGYAVGTWAKDHGFALTPDAPAMLDFYAKRSPIFMAVQFNARRAAARGEQIGDAIPVHLVIPTDRPWVPLRILALGAKPSDPIEADVFLLTDRSPSMLPVPSGDFAPGPVASGLTLERSRAASTGLLADLRSDRGMKWLPTSGMWLSYLRLDAKASDLSYDLALDTSPSGTPSRVDAGLTSPGSRDSAPSALVPVGAGAALLALMLVTRLRRSGPKVPA